MSATKTGKKKKKVSEKSLELRLPAVKVNTQIKPVSMGEWFEKRKDALMRWVASCVNEAQSIASEGRPFQEKAVLRFLSDKMERLADVGHGPYLYDLAYGPDARDWCAWELSFVDALYHFSTIPSGSHSFGSRSRSQFSRDHDLLSAQASLQSTCVLIVEQLARGCAGYVANKGHWSGEIVLPKEPDIEHMLERFLKKYHEATKNTGFLVKDE